jgi:tRNA nucleotidyltransferase/poly(A) polymerase
MASNAGPERVVELFPGAVYENRFGTVAVRRDGEVFEITTFRTDHDYADFRRPHRVEFGDTIELDLARRDFTVNAMAWGARPGEAPGLVDPYEGRTDAAELDKLLAAPKPSTGLRLLSRTGVLAGLSPELAAQRGVPQNKVPGEDLWDHTVRSVDAAPAARPIVRLAALVHDIGKPATFADGRFMGHDAVGAELAGTFLDRLRSPRAVRDRVVELVRQHMFSYESTWSDAAVRRFIGRMAAIGDGMLDELLDLREADNVGSGLPAGAGRLDELRARIAAELRADLVLDRGGLAIDGTDLIEALGLTPGPRLGRILEELVERVIADPALNERPTLLLLAHAALTEDR